LEVWRRAEAGPTRSLVDVSGIGGHLRGRGRLTRVGFLEGGADLTHQEAKCALLPIEAVHRITLRYCEKTYP
jgi:hypothetical protein